MKRFGKIFQLTLLVVLTGILSACGDLLGVRDPELPDQSTESHWVPATTPDLVIANMENAFTYREYETYVKCLSDTGEYKLPLFRFKPSVAASVKYPGKFDVWGLPEEQIWFQSVLAACPKDSLFSLTITEDEPFTESQDTLEYQFSYVLDIRHTRQGLPVKYQGKGIFRMVRDARNTWMIHYWEDIGTGEPDWTDLKALF